MRKCAAAKASMLSDNIEKAEKTSSVVGLTKFLGRVFTKYMNMIFYLCAFDNFGVIPCYYIPFDRNIRL